MKYFVGLIAISALFSFLGCGAFASVDIVHSGAPILVGGSSTFELSIPKSEADDVVFSIEPEGATITLGHGCSCNAHFDITHDEASDVTITATLPNGASASNTFNFVSPDFEVVNEGNPSFLLSDIVVRNTRVQIVPYLNNDRLDLLKGTDNLRFAHSLDITSNRCDATTAEIYEGILNRSVFESSGQLSGSFGYATGDEQQRQDITIYDADTLDIESIDIVTDEATGAVSLRAFTSSGETVSGLRGDWRNRNGDALNANTLITSGATETLVVRFNGLEATVEAGADWAEIPEGCSSFNLLGECTFSFCL